jgi:hypothetical protein
VGGPRNGDEVEPFLRRLFSDPDLIPIPFQQYTAPWIAKRRTPRIRQQYAAIGNYIILYCYMFCSILLYYGVICCYMLYIVLLMLLHSLLDIDLVFFFT